MAHEPDRRRANFRPGPSARLADGQVWVFPDPPDRINPDLAGFLPDYPAILAAISEAEDIPERRRGELVLAIVLLRRNYDLPTHLLRRLLDCPSDSQDATRLRAILADVASQHLRSAWEARTAGATNRPLGHRFRVFDTIVRLVRVRRPIEPSVSSMTSGTA